MRIRVRPNQTKKKGDRAIGSVPLFCYCRESRLPTAEGNVLGWRSGRRLVRCLFRRNRADIGLILFVKCALFESATLDRDPAVFDGSADSYRRNRFGLKRRCCRGGLAAFDNGCGQGGIDRPRAALAAWTISAEFTTASAAISAASAAIPSASASAVAAIVTITISAIRAGAALASVGAFTAFFAITIVAFRTGAALGLLFRRCSFAAFAQTGSFALLVALGVFQTKIDIT